METETENRRRKQNDRRLNIAGIITFLLACFFWVVDRIAK